MDTNRTASAIRKLDCSFFIKTSNQNDTNKFGYSRIIIMKVIYEICLVSEEISLSMPQSMQHTVCWRWKLFKNIILVLGCWVQHSRLLLSYFPFTFLDNSRSYTVKASHSFLLILCRTSPKNDVNIFEKWFIDCIAINVLPITISL